MGNKYDTIKEIVQKYGDIQLPHWLVAVGVLLGLTIKDVTPIITNYQDEDQNVQTQIQVVKNDTLRPPGLYLCTAYKTESLSEVVSGFYNKVPFSVWPFGNRSEKCSACDLLDDNSWNITSDLNMSHTIGENEIVSVIMKRLFASQTLMDEALKPDYTTWNHPIIDAIFMYFLELDNNDRRGIHNPQLANSTNSFVDDIQWPDNSKLEYLARKFSEFMCTFLTFSGDSENYPSINASVCSEKFLSLTFYLQRIDTLNDYKFCFALPTYLGQLGVDLQADPEYEVAFTSLKPNLYQSSRYSIFDENPLFWYNDDFMPTLYNTQNAANLDNPDMLFNQNLILKMAYSVEVNVEEQRETKHCYKDQSQLTCMNRCIVEEMIQKCRCIPFAYRFLITDFNQPYCNMSNYRNCGSKLDDLQIRLENCKAKCKTACNYTSYRWQNEISRIVQELPQRIPQLSLRLKPVLSPFMEFTVSVRDGPQNLVSSVGGILNFYMGVSGLTIFVFIIYLVECLRRIRRLKKEEQASSSDAPIHIWHWKWFSFTASMLMRQDSKSDTSSQKRLNDLEKLLQEQLEVFQEELNKLKSEMSKIKRGNTEIDEEQGQVVLRQNGMNEGQSYILNIAL